MNNLVLARENAIGRIAFNRPAAGNAINQSFADELVEASAALAADPAIRCVTLTGAGRHFCVGGDIAGMAAAGDDAPAFLRKLAGTLHRAVITLATMPKPLVVLVNGPAAGAGLSLALLGDIVLAARSANFTAAYTGIGLTPDGGMSWLLPRLVGVRRAQAMILTNQRVDAEEAERIGLITRAVHDPELPAIASDIIDRVVAAPTAALGAARGLLLQGAAASLLEHLDREAEAIASAGGSAEAREGLSAFLARRKPDFRGA